MNSTLYVYVGSISKKTMNNIQFDLYAQGLIQNSKLRVAKKAALESKGVWRHAPLENLDINVFKFYYNAIEYRVFDYAT